MSDSLGWMPDSVDLTLLGAGYFVFLQVFLSNTVCYLEAARSFWVWLVWFVMWGQGSAQSKADHLRLLKWECPWVLNLMPCELRKFLIWLQTDIIPALVLLWCYFLQSFQMALSCVHVPVSALWHPRGRGPSLCAAFSSLVFCSMGTGCLCLSGHQLCLLNSGSAWLCLSFLFP